MTTPVRPLASPLFATDATFATGPEVGLSTRLDPGAGIRAQGVLPESRYAARWENFQKGTLGDWVKYLDDRQLTLPAANWPERASFHNAGDNAAANLNVGLAWSPDIVSGGTVRAVQSVELGRLQFLVVRGRYTVDVEVLLNAAAVNNPCVAYGRINGGAVAGFVATWVNPTGLHVDGRHCMGHGSHHGSGQRRRLLLAKPRALGDRR
jgi:hypothetical protein